MNFKKAKPEDFEKIKNFYWNLIDLMKSSQSRIGWKKGIYPTDAYLLESLEKGELYVLEDGETLCGSVIINSAFNEGYETVRRKTEFEKDEIWVLHALAVSPVFQGRGLGRAMLEKIIELSRENGKKALRLDILSGNEIAERLYVKAGFEFVSKKPMFYEDTGLTEYKLFELIL